MRSLKRTWMHFSFGLVSIGFLCAMQAAGAQEYRITQIANLPGAYSLTTSGISKSGQVAGSSGLVVFGNGASAVLYSGGSTQQIPGIPGRGVYELAVGINDKGWVTGTDYDDGHGAQAFLYNDGATQGIPAAESSYAAGLNNNGDVAGFADLLDGGTGAFLYNHAQRSVTLLGFLPGGSNSYATAVDDAGLVAGYGDKGGGAQYAFVYQNGKFTLLGSLPGGTSSQSSGINQCGWVTGWAATKNATHAFLYQNGHMKDLGVPLGVHDSQGYAVNNYGDVVGVADGRAVVYTNGKMRDLNFLVPPNSGWVFQSATGINDAGQISITAADTGGTNTFGLVLTPTRPPAARQPCDAGH